MDPSIIVPVFGIFMIIAVVIGPIWITAFFRSKERAELHQTLRTAYEKGLPPPPELIEKLAASRLSTPSSPDYDLRRAVILISVGLGLGLLGLALGYGIGFESPRGGWITGASVAGAGAIPGLIGLGHLVLWLNRRKTSNA